MLLILETTEVGIEPVQIGPVSQKSLYKVSRHPFGFAYLSSQPLEPSSQGNFFATSSHGHLIHETAGIRGRDEDGSRTS